MTAQSHPSPSRRASTSSPDAQKYRYGLLARLNQETLEDRGTYWRASCPCPGHDHGDQGQSLSISVSAETGALLLNCFVGHEAAEILFALGASWSEIYPDADDAKGGQVAKPRGSGKLARAYDYRDKHGVLIFQNCRMEPKSFVQRRPDPEQQGRWIWNLTGVKKVLYNLPKLVETAKRRSADEPDRSAEPVFVCEGEKDADNLSRGGFISTTNSCGANSWNGDYSKSLKNRHVIIVEDNDLAGRTRTTLIGKALLGFAASIRVIHFRSRPNNEDKFDVSDFISGLPARKSKDDESIELPAEPKHSKAEFLELVDRAVPWEATQHPETLKGLNDHQRATLAKMRESTPAAGAVPAVPAVVSGNLPSIYKPDSDDDDLDDNSDDPDDPNDNLIPLQSNEADNDPHRLARLYLNKFHSAIDESTGESFWTLKTWQESYFAYLDATSPTSFAKEQSAPAAATVAPRYVEISPAELRSRLTALCKAEFDRINLDWQANPTPTENGTPETLKVSTSLVRNVIQAIDGYTTVPGTLEPPVWVGPAKSAASAKEGSAPPSLESPAAARTPNRRSFISVANGILDLSPVIDSAKIWRDSPSDAALPSTPYDPFASAETPLPIVPHSPHWFSRTCLPYAYDPAATCPTWLRIIDQNLESDADRIALLQEWFGYNLLPDCSYQKFMLLEGEGANGKSVILKVLETILGEQNVSSVPLENFGERFQLTETLGKLANICPDLNEIDRVCEGHLKAFTSGDRMQFERRYREGISAVPTARCTFSMNNRPRLSDRSEGVWRRMLLISFNRPVPENEKIRSMDTAKFWIDSGELPGILNWAIEGLFRLHFQYRFTEPESSRRVIAEYRIENNPAAQFLTENYMEHERAQTTTSSVYDAYVKFCKANGYREFGERTFGKEVKRLFPTIERAYVGPRTNRFYVYRGLVSQAAFNPDTGEVTTDFDFADREDREHRPSSGESNRENNLGSDTGSDQSNLDFE